MAFIPLLLWTFLERPGKTSVRVRGGRIRRRWQIREGRRIGLGLPSPVDAFHRPQAPAPPHVTTLHERAPRVDGTGGDIGQGSEFVKNIFRPALRRVTALHRECYPNGVML